MTLTQVAFTLKRGQEEDYPQDGSWLVDVRVVPRVGERVKFNGQWMVVDRVDHEISVFPESPSHEIRVWLRKPISLTPVPVEERPNCTYCHGTGYCGEYECAYCAGVGRAVST